MTEDEKNVWRQSSLTNAEIKISKRNPNTTGLITQVIPWTSIGVEVTSNNTILFNWDTRSLSKGDYTVQVRYTLLEQTFVSEEFSLVLR